MALKTSAAVTTTTTTSGPACARAAFSAAADAAARQLHPLAGRAIHVNGASGFLAANLIALLHEASRTHGLDLTLHASARRSIDAVPLFRFLDMPTPDVTWELADAEHTTLPLRPGVIAVHTASPAAPADYLSEPLVTFRANTEGLIQTFREAQRVGAAHVVFVSSAEIYGQPPASLIPTPESYEGGPRLGDPRSIYAESKRMAEALGTVLSQQTGIPFTAVRPWNLYGPGQRIGDGRVPLALMRMARQNGQITLHSDGSPRRSPCFVWDGLLQLIACLDPAGADGAVNIGNSSEELSILELAQACATEAGLPADSVSAAPAGSAAAGLARCAPGTERVQARARVPLPEFTPLTDGLARLREWVDWSLADA